METIAKVRRRYHLNKESVSRIARKMNLSRTTVRNYEVRLSVEHGRVIVEPATTIANLTLVDRLNLFDPVLHGGEVMTAERVGAELW